MLKYWKTLLFLFGFLFVVACGSVQQNPPEQKQGKGITIYEDPSLSDTPKDGGIYLKEIKPVTGARYGSCTGVNPYSTPEGPMNCTFPLLYQDAYQRNYQFVAYGPAWSAEKVVFRKVGDWWNPIPEIWGMFGAVIYRNGCYGVDKGCRHFWSDSYTKIDIKPPVNKTVYFYLIGVN